MNIWGKQRSHSQSNKYMCTFLTKLLHSLYLKKPFMAVKNRRALSPIFATLIILAVVTVLFVPVFIWASGIGNQTEASWQASGVAATERIVIEEVTLNGAASPQNCTIYVRNIGPTTVTISNVIITPSDDSSNIQMYQKVPIPTPTPSPMPTPSPTPLMQLKTVEPPDGSDLKTITKGNLIEIQIPRLNWPDSSFTLTNGDVYIIKVTTTRGASDSFQIVASW